MTRPTCIHAVLAAAMLAIPTAADGPPVDPADIRFDRDIRPILSDHCFQCHGPDAATRAARLRLDDPAIAFAARGDRPAAIVAGDAHGSLMMERIRSTGADVMPPPEIDKPLSARDIALLEAWIESGAEWEEHWAFVPPQRVEPPVPARGGSDHPIDAFLERRLDDEGLVPLPRADRATQLRRVTFDLTGLPPTLDELDAWLDDEAPGAYDRVVDRLLSSPRFGEHKARYWLDAARYADTHGLHLDNIRVMWKYRDWVVGALNRNVPFDQFTIEQLGGDMLPEPTLEQRVASGFNRCHVTTSEGGAIDAEYLVEYAVDRVDTTSTIWLGLTMGCARCHDHKYDPISQREFFQLFAFFNSTAERAMDGNAAAPPPVVRVPDETQTTQLAAYDDALATYRAEFAAPPADVETSLVSWTVERTAEIAAKWATLTPETAVSRGGATMTVLDDQSVLVSGANPDTDVYEFTMRTDEIGLRAISVAALLDDSMPIGPGRFAGNGNFVLSEVEATVTSVADDANSTDLRFVDARADHEQQDFGIAYAIDGKLDNAKGWATLGGDHPAPRQAIFITDAPFGYEGGTEITVRLHFVSVHKQHTFGRVRLSVTSDAGIVPSQLGGWEWAGPFEGANRAEAFATDYGPEAEARADGPWDEKTWQPIDAPDGVAKLFDGTTNAAHYVRRTLHVPSSRSIEFGFGSDDAVKVWIDDALVHQNDVNRGVRVDQDRVRVEVSEGDHVLLMKIVNAGGPSGFAFRVIDEGQGVEPPKVAATLARRAEDRSDEDRAAIREWYLANEWARGKELTAAIAETTQHRAALEAQVVTTLVSQELAERRPAHILERGMYDAPGETVQPDVPSVLPPMAEGAPRSRLGFAQWLVHPDHPLTARVTVNRIWQEYFGTGLVRTSEDFGVQGERPSHPELLDFLALWFIDNGWDVKALHRLIVTSEAYRRDARVTREHLEADPDNRLLARGPRFRLDAEMIRDQALATSGLLVETMGGPPVKPYQPDGIWYAVGYSGSNTVRFTQDAGDKLYRRSVYTFWKRTAPPPAMTTFDAPSRETCTVRRERTNTPLAALVLLNDPQFVEAARHLAERIMRYEGSTEERIAYAFRLVTSREPDDVEAGVLAAFLDEQRGVFGAAPERASALLAVGDSPRDEALDAIDAAAWTMVANILLNLDEAITKG